MTRSGLLLLALAATASAQNASPPPSPEGASVPAAASRPDAPASPGREPQDDRLRRVAERRQALEREVAQLRNEEKSLLGEVERLELEVRLRGERLREIQMLLQRTNAQLDATLGRTRELTKSLDQARPVLAARARALYKLGEVSYLRLVLSVERPSDIMRGYRFVTALARRDNERIAAFRADIASLAAAKSDLEGKTREALGLRSDLERTRRSLDADRKNKTQLLTEIVERKETNAAYLQELADAEAKLQGLLGGLGQGDVSVPVAAFKGTLPWPAAGKVRVPFGRRKHARFDTYTIQNGIEIAAAQDTPVAAVYEGTVVFADRFKGYGLMVALDHGGKHHTLYAHLGDVLVQVGQKVSAGEVLGSVGPGLEGPGLYFEVRFQGRPEDPAEWLRDAAGKAPL